MRRPHQVFGVLVALMSGGCAAMSESECRFANWRQLGEHDARQGRTAQYFVDRAEACSEHGLEADRAAYQAGRQQGLDRFCAPHGGFSHGIEGRPYRETCQAGAERGFLAGYTLGRDIHEAEEQLDRLDSEIASLEDELDEVTDPESDESRRLEREIRDRRSEIRAVERELGRLEAIAVERGFPLRKY